MKIWSINGSTKAGKVAFSLVKNCKTKDYLEGNCKQAWDHLVNKYSSKTAPSYIKLKKTFTNSVLESHESDPVNGLLNWRVCVLKWMS